jgi:microcystin-dependent protein
MCKTIVLSGTLTALTTIIFPSSISKSYEIYNLASNAATYGIVLAPASGGGRTLGAPPGDMTDVFYNATWSSTTYSGFHLKNRHVGALLEFGGSSVPAWVSISSPPPYLNCDGSTFNATTYPMLNSFLGGNTLPDLRGTTKATLNQGTGRMSVVDGNTNLSIGGVETVTLASSQIPDHTHSINDPGHHHTFPMTRQNIATTDVTGNYAVNATLTNTSSATTGITINPTTGGGGSHAIVQPTTICGITMIRAA